MNVNTRMVFANSVAKIKLVVSRAHAQMDSTLIQKICEHVWKINVRGTVVIIIVILVAQEGLNIYLGFWDENSLSKMVIEHEKEYEEESS